MTKQWFEEQGFKKAEVWVKKGRGEWFFVGSEKHENKYIMKRVEKWVGLEPTEKDEW